MNAAFHEEVARRLRAGRTVAIATVVAAQGSTPRAFGAKMIVLDDGTTLFSVGGGAFEALIIEDARAAIRSGRGGEKEYRLVEEGERATGMVCGGTARVLIEVVAPPVPLLVFGAGHVGREVALLGDRLGFAVTVLDDRARWLEPSRFPQSVERRRVAADYGADLPEVPRGAFVAVVTRCHRTDLAGVRAAVGRGAAYVGLIGSRRKVRTVLERAAAAGAPPEAIAEVRGPIGLDIGAETPEEIAVSILAEMIAVKNAAPGAAGRAAIPLGLRRGAATAPRRPHGMRLSR